MDVQLIIVIAVCVCAAAFAVFKCVRSMSGKGSCCGSGGSKCGCCR